MKDLSIEAKGQLADLLGGTDQESVLILKDGKPVGILIRDPDDAERLALARNPKFRELMEKSKEQFRNGEWLTHEEFWASFDLPAKKPRSKPKSKAKARRKSA